MVILDIDLDFFLKDIIHNPKKARPSNSYIDVWEPAEVINFLEKRCNLNKNKKIKGKFLKTHDELFYCFKKMIEKKIINVPFELVHIDAHADLGLRDCSYKYIMTELLHKPVIDRLNPKNGGWEGLSEVNLLAFSIACRWINKLTYVHHPRMHNLDIGWVLMKDFDINSGAIQLKKVSLEEFERNSLNISNCNVLELEPEVPINLIETNSFTAKNKFAYMFLAHSPKYTPPKADKLIPIILEYIDETLNI